MTESSYPSLSPAEVHALAADGSEINLVDVRTSGEFNEIHAVGAVNVPLGGLTADAVRAIRRGPAEQPFYVICQSGMRSRTACDRLSAAGLNVVNVKGGTSAWVAAGLPVERQPGSGSGGMKPMLRMLAFAAVALCLILAGTVNLMFAWLAVGIWFAMVMLNGGCPFGACAFPSRPTEDVHSSRGPRGSFFN